MSATSTDATDTAPSTATEALSFETKFRLLLEITRAISTSLDLDETLSLIIDSVKSFVPYDAAAIYILETNGRDRRIRATVYRGYDEAAMERMLHLGEGFVGWVIQSGGAIVIPDVRNDQRYISSDPLTMSEIAVPIVANNRIIGALNLESRTLNAYRAADLEVLTLFASTAAISIEKAILHQERLEKRRLESELAIARQVQRSLLPNHAPALDGFDIAGLTVPNEAVGGDYYDFIPFPNHQLGIAIADVSGKGVPAALIMATFRACLRAQVRNDFSIRVILRKVNYLLWESLDSSQYVTAIYGVLDPANRLFSYGDAGHNPALLIHADGSHEKLSCGNTVLGLFEDRKYIECYRALQPGDIVVLYTDGVTEAERDGEEFGTERLLATVQRHRQASAQEIVQAVYREAQAFAGSSALGDDLTVVIIKALDVSTDAT
ncbi:MAG: GAF domain-containing SpoIIE family protein phosphatase [Chloracidobacterium sp.]|uniref:SpoIIE family protein phosphatase n=1 Tax=Chloracidobacterium validum TaxID=2821543 RepID=A0ABX8B634_9BACT|nr:GAF domain-containing SpoIIE family protein phosphatase [Chloracidobacterium validum]QUW02423.1 SpoIIE family protein phosphatase [Chloracidobacterium validum]